MAHSDGRHCVPAEEVQLDMFGAPPLPRDLDRESLRAELADILAEARDTPADPWDARDASYYRGMLSGVADDLETGDSELQQLRLELETELARLAATA
ncbi:MAG TPA: hypothetical protein VFZ16_02365 [Hyphomicrobiaceae bacterium]|nr:hypothetical protein [Hyphomicrobiaceae bacterium]